MAKKPTIIIQARTGSSRLPSKMILPFFNGKNILDILLQRLLPLKEDKIIDKLIVATSDAPNDDKIQTVCENNNVICFRGNEKDVLQRFIDAAEANNIEDIIRVCADNIFLDINSLIRLATTQMEKDVDYISFQHSDGTPSIKTHFGFFAERVKLDTLKKVASITSDPIYHEHVTNKIYEPDSPFTTLFIPIEAVVHGIESHPNLRLTTDTASDFELMQKIYTDVLKYDEQLKPSSIIEYLGANPQYYEIMKQNIIQNSK
ncbi:MAG: glycosyl transferase family 2 [Paramuribaculum sp.]|nr:glycosyl transferase family 2 [Paramuribaculum sp.]